MSNKLSPAPTEAELAILSVLWRRGPSMVREVQEVLNEKKPTGYTTVLKLMQIMLEKGLVTRDESRRPHVYQPSAPPERTQARLVGDFIDRVFEGSTSKLILKALSTKRVAEDELKHIRSLLDEYEQENS